MSAPTESLFEEVHGSIPVDCTDRTLRLAMVKLGPAFVYELHVSQIELLDTINRIRVLTAAPLAHQINVYMDHRLKGGQWFLTVDSGFSGIVHAERFGSRAYS